LTVVQNETLKGVTHFAGLVVTLDARQRVDGDARDAQDGDDEEDLLDGHVVGKINKSE
jgi:hypothetical protein